MEITLLSLPIIAIDKIIAHVDCKTIRAMVCTSIGLHNYIKTRIGFIFNDIYLDPIIRAFLLSTKVKVVEYSDFLKIYKIIEDDFTIEYYYYKGIAKYTKGRKQNGGRNKSIIPNNEITDKFHSYIERYMNESILYFKGGSMSKHKHERKLRNIIPDIPSCVNPEMDEYQDKLNRLFKSIKIFISKLLSAYHDLTLTEYILAIRNFLYHITFYDPKRNIMDDTKGVIASYRQLQLDKPMPYNHAGHFYLYLLLRYHDINRTMLNCINSQSGRYGRYNGNNILFMDFENVRTYDYVEPLYKMVCTNLNDKNYSSRCNIIVKLFKNAHDKAKKLIKKNILYYDVGYAGIPTSMPTGKISFKYSGQSYEFKKAQSYASRNQIDNLYLKISEIYNLADEISLNIKYYKPLMKVINNGLVIDKNHEHFYYNKGCYFHHFKDVAEYLQQNPNKIEYMIKLCDLDISTGIILKILNKITSIDNFVHGYKLLENKYKYEMNDILLFLSTNDYELPDKIDEEIQKFNKKELPYFYMDKNAYSIEF